MAGVSVGTVSNVINGRAVGAATREAVELAIGRLDFKPDRVARSLIARRARRDEDDGRGTVPRLTTIGYVSADYTARVAVLPHRADRAVAQTIDKTLGGPAANVAVTAAGLGSPFPLRCELLTVLGDDADSEWARALLAERGVRPVAVTDGPAGRLARCIIVVEANGARTILYEPFAIPEAEVLAHLRELPHPGPAHGLHLQGYHAPDLLGAVAQAGRRGLLTSVHTTGLPAAWLDGTGFARLRRSFDVVFLNREAAQTITGCGGPQARLLQALCALVRETTHDGRQVEIVLTLDEAGAVLLADAEPLHLPAPHVEPLDTTGAGDTFAGVYLAARLNGTSTPEALRHAVAAASRSVMIAGAQELVLSGTELAALADALPRRVTPNVD